MKCSFPHFRVGFGGFKIDASTREERENKLEKENPIPKVGSLFFVSLWLKGAVKARQGEEDISFYHTCTEEYVSLFLSCKSIPITFKSVKYEEKGRGIVCAQLNFCHHLLCASMDSVSIKGLSETYFLLTLAFLLAALRSNKSCGEHFSFMKLAPNRFSILEIL